MTRTSQLNLRVDDETQARWKAAATDAGYSLAEFVREAVDARLESDATPTTKAKRAKRIPAAKVEHSAVEKGVAGDGSSRRARTTMCAHRRPPELHCKVCD